MMGKVIGSKCVSSTLRSWLHSRIKFCPLDWRSTLNWNVVLTIFQHDHICQDCWKNTRSTFECTVIPKSRGQAPKKMETTRQICPVLSTRIWTLSPGLENNQTLKSWSGSFPTILKNMIMLENCQKNISVYGCFPIQGTKFYSCWSQDLWVERNTNYLFFNNNQRHLKKVFNLQKIKNKYV